MNTTRDICSARWEVPVKSAFRLKMILTIVNSFLTSVTPFFRCAI